MAIESFAFLECAYTVPVTAAGKKPPPCARGTHKKQLLRGVSAVVKGGEVMAVMGPSGAGKKTRVMALLRQLHGSSVEKLKVEARSFKFGSSSTTTDLTLVSSAHHVELNPSDAGIRDREVVSELIKEIAQAAPIITGGGASAAAPPFKVVVLNEVERLSKPARGARGLWHGQMAP